MTIIQADALGLYAGRSWATGLPETCHCEARSAEAISLSNFPLP